MSNTNGNPLYNIFLKNSQGKLTDELDNINNIQYFFNYIKNDKVTDEEKASLLEALSSKIQNNRYISSFFENNNKISIYIYLFDLFSKNNSSKTLKDASISLIEVLIANIQTGKDIFEYLFQKLSQIYRGEIEPTSKNLHTYLKLLQTVLAEIEPRTPKNYFACSGHCQFNVDMNKVLLEVGHSFSINLNFKISNCDPEQKNNRLSNLVKIYFSNQKSLSFDLLYPYFIIVKEVGKEFLKPLASDECDEWLNLLITIVNLKNTMQVYFYVNGEKHMTPYKIEKFGIKPDTSIKYINFFNNFYGEVGSIYMFSQKESGNPGVNNSGFLNQLKNYTEGLWKKSKIDSFLKILQTYDSIDKGDNTSKISVIKSYNGKIAENRRSLFDNLVFLFSPINTDDKRPNIIEDTFGKYVMKYSGNIKSHKFQSYQKKLLLVGGFSNFYPIAEMFLIYPEILTEPNFEIFLKTLGSTLNFRKQNLKIVNKSKLFKILSMFMEKYPNKVYTEKILNALFSLGKTLFINNLETECSTYFNYILLNEKILSKFNENLQSTFWKKLFLFCQSDITQVETFLNINRLCLILRFYDRNKYKEMCCQEHLDVVKDKYLGSKKVMNPTMNAKLSQLKNIMNLIIDSPESNNALSFFKLLTLDLSPCLIKFIINIFIKAFDKSKINDNWKKNFIEQLIQNKYEVIIINTFIHALPDVRILLLSFIYQIHNKLVLFQQFDKIETLERMLKTCLLPDKMFYNKKIPNLKENRINENINKKEESKNNEIKKIEKVEIKKESIIKEKENKKDGIKKQEPPKEIIIDENKNKKTSDNDKSDKKQIEEEKDLKNEIKEEIENLKIDEIKKGDIKDYIPENEDIYEKQVIKEDDQQKNEDKEVIEKKPEEIKKAKTIIEEPKKPEIKKEETQNEIVKKNLRMSQLPPSRPDKDKIKEFRPSKTICIKDDSKNTAVNSKRQNFLALISKFDTQKNDQSKQEIKKPPPKLMKKDNPFLQKLNQSSLEEKKRKEEERKEKERKEKEKKEKEEKEKDEKERKEKEEKERLEKEEKERKEKEEKERLEKEKKEKEEREKLEKERLEKEKKEKEEKEREEKEKKEKEEKERQEKERLDKERKNKEEKERQEKERLDKERMEKLDEENNLNQNNQNSDEELIIKDKIYNDYIESLYSIFLLWTLSIDVSIPYTAITFKKCYITNTNGLEILFLLNNKIKNKSLLMIIINSINAIINIPNNAYQIFCNRKVFASFLDILFEHYRLTGKEEIKCYNLIKNILLSSFAYSFEYCEKKLTYVFPGKDVETLFIWGNKIILNDGNKKEEVFEFIFELLMEFMTQYKVNYEPKLMLNSDKSYDVEKNYYMKNYLYFINHVFNFIFRYRLDDYINSKGISNLFKFTNSKITIPNEIIKNMRMKDSESAKICDIWIDFPLINDIMSKSKVIWSKKNCYKGYNYDNIKKNKFKKYDYIIENIITNKDKKNMNQKELEFLCYEDIDKKDKKTEYIIPLIKVVSLTLISILTKLKDFKDDKDFKYWLKEFKYFLKFLIISSANITKINQLELYNSIQDKVLEAIASGFCFLNYLLSCNCQCNNKIEKIIISLLLLSFKILKYQFNYKLKHKKVFNFGSKPTRNNLEDCAICKLFDLFVKDNSGNPLINLSLLDTLNLDNNNYNTKLLNLIKSSDFIDAFFENQNLKYYLYERIYSLSPYQCLVKKRYSSIIYFSDILDESYKLTILQLLPQYENELAKYSNNSLEKAIKNKNRYKVFKKNAFSWRGYWSHRDDFFKNISSFKLKLINHYTKNFMKPILEPIIDISYYLPEFSGFDPKNLFLPEDNNKIFKLNMDIDKVLKTSENSAQENIISDNREKEETNENYLVNIYKKSNSVLYEKLLKISYNLEFGKEEEFSFVERDTSQETKKKYFLSCLVKTSHHIKGVVFIDDKKLNFKVFLNQKTGNAMSGVEKGFTTEDDDYDQERKTCFGSFFVCHPKDKDLYKISINYKDIKWIFKRKYYYTNSALEIFTTTNKTFYFNFKFEVDRTAVLEELLKKMDEPIPIIDDYKESKSQSIIGYENGLVQKKKGIKMKAFNLSKLVKSWKNWEISNFDFLMWLNIFGNRSYNDISQYPVFPWILINYEDPLQVEHQEIIENENGRTISMALPEMQNPINMEIIQPLKTLNNKIQVEKVIIDYVYRDMSLPMGMLEINDESIKRKEEFEMNYETLLELGDENNKPYVFGSNYSNPIYVCNYLMRLFPFTHISIELQGKGFDKPDRLFNSVKTSFFNSTTQKGDVRELIPEFFYLPEMFRNINNLNMGKLDNGDQVGDVLTPCSDNPYDFIMTMRSCLENNKISLSIHNWIDLIFGYKSRGKEAEKVKNIYKEASYQELIDINKVESKESQLREAEFGLIPNQLFVKECSKKDKKEVIRKGKEITDQECDLQWYECKFNNENEKFRGIEGYDVIKIASFNQEKVLILLGGLIFMEIKVSYSILNKSYNKENVSVYVINKYINRMKEYYHPKKPDSKAIQFCHKGKTAIFGGFYDGKILIKSTSSEQKDNYKIEIPFLDKSPVVVVAVDKDDEFAFLGNQMGNIRILKLDKDIKECKLDLMITDHLSAISYIHCNSDLNLWASASVDGYINLYTLPLCKLLRCLKIDTPYCDYAFLCASPLPCIVAIGEENNISEIFVYSINGELCLRQQEQDIIKSPIIIKDLNSKEYLSYIINESIIIREIPTLVRQASIEDIPGIHAIYPSEDMRIMYAINKEGTNIRVIKDGK